MEHFFFTLESFVLKLDLCKDHTYKVENKQTGVSGAYEGKVINCN